MQYLLVHFVALETNGYQEVFKGNLQRITDMDGNTMSEATTGDIYVVDANPTPPSWALPDPIEPVIKPAPVQLSKLEFLEAFTEDELELIYTAAKTVVKIEIFLDKFKLAEYIDATDPKLQLGIRALEAGGLLATGRADEILATLGV